MDLMSERGTHGERRVVVGVDESSSARAALWWAFGEARARGADITVLHAFGQPLAVAGDVGDPRDVSPERAAAGQALLDQLREQIGPDFGDVPVRWELAAGHRPGEALVDAAGDTALLVIGARGRRGIDTAALGSVVRYCVCHARCPVVVIPGQ